MSGRVLIVAYYFPPVGGIGSIRLARFAALLPEHGWEATVLAPHGTPHPSDPSLRFPEEHVVRARSIELSQVGRTALREPAGHNGSSAPQLRQRLRTALRTGAHSYLFYPDPQVGWYPAAVAAGWRTLRQGHFDVLYSSSNPMTAHLVARTLSRRTGTPWVAEYRDPWRDRLPSGQPYRQRALELERTIARDATRVVMPTRTWAAHYGSQWDTDVAVLPNGYDAQHPERRPAKRPTLVHIGSYYNADHDLATLWRALARMRDDDPTSVPRVRFVGNMPAELSVEIAGFGLGDLLESAGVVPHATAMRELMSASMLIASGIAGDHPAKRGWVPAKLFEYLASGIPMLYLGDPDTDAGRLLAGHAGVHVVRPGDVDGAVGALRASLGGPDAARDVGHLSRAAGAATLAAILDNARRATPA